MIRSKKDYQFYLKADRIALGCKPTENWIKNVLFPDQIWRFQRLLRRTEYYFNCKKGLLWKLSKLITSYRFKRLGEKLGFTIPLNVFGPGLSIAHRGTIVVNENAIIGANCRIHICVNIGTSAGYSDKAPIIGDNIYIGPGAKIYGDIKIANNTAIAANAVVNKNFIVENNAIGGIPAKVLRQIDIRNMNILATELLKTDLSEDLMIGKTAKEINELYKNLNK